MKIASLGEFCLVVDFHQGRSATDGATPSSIFRLLVILTMGAIIINRPGVAGAVLHTALSVIN